MLEKHNVDIRTATMKYEHTHTVFVEAFNKELAKLLFKPMDAQELQDPENVSTIWAKHLKKIVNKMSNTISSMIGMKPKDAIKLDTLPLDKIYPKETVLPEDRLWRYLISLANNMDIKKDGQLTLSGVKIHTDWIELYKTQVILSCTICKTELVEFLYMKN